MSTTPDTPAIAVLGTGTIGAPIARNLRSAGYSVRAWNRTPEKAAALARDGIQVADSPAAAVAGADIVLTVVKDAAAVLDVLDSAADGFTPGTVLVQISTVGVAGIAEIAAVATARKLRLVDAPVQGSKEPAEKGQLVVLAAGPDEVHDAVAPVFAAIAKSTLWVSPLPGEASKLKLVINTLISAINHGVAEAISLAEALGVDPQTFLAAIAGGPLESAFGASKAKAIVARDFTPSFTIDNAIKDAQLISDAAASAGLWLPQAQAGLERYRAAAQAGHGGDDMAATYFASQH